MSEASVTAVRWRDVVTDPPDPDIGRPVWVAYPSGFVWVARAYGGRLWGYGDDGPSGLITHWAEFTPPSPPVRR